MVHSIFVVRREIARIAGLLVNGARAENDESADENLDPRDVAPFPFWLNLGVPNMGGPIVTASGLAFIAATTDNFIRAFNVTSGEKLWQARLPAGGQAIPVTYRLTPW